jgi:predicted subunit of tRNA(5-methylaminomethyl-2-thiouridylate) methyltransferase
MTSGHSIVAGKGRGGEEKNYSIGHRINEERKITDGCRRDLRIPHTERPEEEKIEMMRLNCK